MLDFFSLVINTMAPKVTIVNFELNAFIFAQYKSKNSIRIQQLRKYQRRREKNIYLYFIFYLCNTMGIN